jgi:mannonate dehydratase
MPRKPTRFCPTATAIAIALHPGEEPGLGVEIDEKLAAKYSYQRAYLPVNRLEDGSMTN